jgi:hypothetical protein
MQRAQMQAADSPDAYAVKGERHVGVCASLRPDSDSTYLTGCMGASNSVSQL